jgi:2-isopropylmalate synthase
MFTQGVDPELDFTDIEEARRVYEFANRMTLPDRQPYVGDLVFTAFSGSHQDAIKKGMADIYDVQPGEPLDGEYDTWDVPYLPIDPRHLGRSYEAVIRVNSQSGKGGVSYVLLHEYGLDLPRQLQVDFAKKIQVVTEDTGTEITSYEIHRRFMGAYVEPASPKVEIIGHRSSSDTLESGTTTMEAKLIVNGREQMVTGEGNGPIDAFVAALTGAGLFEGKIADYSEHTMGTGSDATAVAYVEVDTGARDTTWGVGMHESIVSASLRAIVSAVNTLQSSARGG